jgi:hypothetical protein
MEIYYRLLVMFCFIWLAMIDVIGARSIVRLHKRIVNGEMGSKLPWMVSLQTPEREHFCGGSLIYENIVLTGNIVHSRKHR